MESPRFTTSLRDALVMIGTLKSEQPAAMSNTPAITSPLRYLPVFVRFMHLPPLCLPVDKPGTNPCLALTTNSHRICIDPKENTKADTTHFITADIEITYRKTVMV